MKYKFVNQGGINWEWLLVYEEVEGGVRLVLHDRWHRGESRPRWVEACFALAEVQAKVDASATSVIVLDHIKEGSGRTAVSLIFKRYDVKMDRGVRLYENGQLFDVLIINPAYVFNYDGHEEVAAYMNKEL